VVIQSEPSLRGTLQGGIERMGRCRALVMEKLSLLATWDNYPRLHNLIRPLLVNDIPTVLFWACPIPADLERLTSMAALADRTIVDGTLFDGDDWATMQQLAAPPLDLCHLRLAPWRRALAECFEQFEWTCDTPTKATIEHRPTCGSLNAARCLEHWLVGKLDAGVERMEVPSDTPDGQPSRLRLDHGAVTVEIRHLGIEAILSVELSLADRCILPTRTRASQGTRAGLLAGAIDTRP
jgi:glucose-6-phosphate dehydrogenase assembly protein OpcA